MPTDYPPLHVRKIRRFVAALHRPASIAIAVPTAAQFKLDRRVPLVEEKRVEPGEALGVRDVPETPRLTHLIGQDLHSRHRRITHAPQFPGVASMNPPPSSRHALRLWSVIRKSHTAAGVVSGNGCGVAQFAKTNTMVRIRKKNLIMVSRSSRHDRPSSRRSAPRPIATRPAATTRRMVNAAGGVHGTRHRLGHESLTFRRSRRLCDGPGSGRRARNRHRREPGSLGQSTHQSRALWHGFGHTASRGRRRIPADQGAQWSSLRLYLHIASGRGVDALDYHSHGAFPPNSALITSCLAAGSAR